MTTDTKAPPVAQTKLYNSPRWAFLLRRIIGTETDTYLDRIYIIQTPLFGIMLHRIYRPDRQRDLHDHPWNFFSLVLRGSYVEAVPCDGCALYGCSQKESEPAVPHNALKRRRWWNYKKAEDRHSISECSRRPVWTLVFTGRKRRVWGFWVDGGTRWVKWTEYDKVEQP